jgi:hypothetical protein
VNVGLGVDVTDGGIRVLVRVGVISVEVFVSGINLVFVAETRNSTIVRCVSNKLLQLNVKTKRIMKGIEVIFLIKNERINQTLKFIF